MPQKARPIQVLLVDDSPADVRLTREALGEGKIPSELSVVGDGVEALRYLRREGAYATVSRPDLVLLDLNLPRKSGREVLEEIKSDPDLRRIPVMVLTTSRLDEDLDAAYSLHANCYIRKPVNLDDFLDVVRSIEQFWFMIVTLPPS